MIINTSTFLTPVSPQNPKKPKPQTTHISSSLNHHHINTETITQITHNKVLIASSLSALIGQFSKPFTRSILHKNTSKNKNFDIDFDTFLQAGGFPSTHSSAVVAAAAGIGFERGFDDSVFGLSVVFAALVMYDAQGVRREVGNHAKTLNKILPQTRVCSNSEKLSKEIASCSSLKSDDKIRKSMISSEAEPDQEILEIGERSVTSLKESVGHTEIEVFAGALLGFLVSFAVNTLP